MLSENMSLEEVQAFFSQDRFATDACGARVVKAAKGHAVCEMTLSEAHCNAMGGVMGGVTFTLADFALAIACNLGENATVAVTNTIQFLSAPKGKKLIATCSTNKSGRTLGYYTVDVKDELDTPVACMSATCYRKSS